MCTTCRSGASENLSEIQHQRGRWTGHRRKLETEKLACQSAVRSLDTHVAHILQLRGMLEVERQKSETRQAEVLSFGQANLLLSQQFDRSKEEVAQLQSSLQ